MNHRRLPWLALLLVLASSCRELIGIDEASVDPALAGDGSAAGAGGEAGAGN